MEKSSKQIIGVFSFFTLLLLAAFALSTIAFIKAVKAKSWPSTEGLVLEASVKRVPSSKGPTKYEPLINYAYKTEKGDFTSDKYSTMSARGSSEWAKEVVAMHPVNSSIKVYYNPDNNAKSVLEPGLHKDNYWMTFGSLFFLTVVLIGFRKQIRDIKNKKTKGEVTGA